MNKIKLSDVLYIIQEIWDPIGVKGVIEAEDEYYAYIGEIISIIQNKNSSKEIFQTLRNIEINKMGIHYCDTTEKASQMLWELRNKLEKN